MTHSTPAFSPAADLAWQEMAPGVRRTLVAYNDDLLLVKVEFETGAVGALHQHVHSQISYVESGEFEVTVGGETRVLRAGDTFYAAPNVPHGVLARQAGVLLDSFSPVRLDFLPATI
jgi:quercetin dioxygenase-like cupin family protein